MAKVTFLGLEFTMCDAYVDMKHRIGEDYIGHKCACLAACTFNGHDLCVNCINILDKEPKRITFDYEGKNGN